MVQKEKLSFRERLEKTRELLFDFTYTIKIPYKDKDGDFIYVKKHRSFVEKSLWVLALWPSMILCATLMILLIQKLASGNFLQQWSFLAFQWSLDRYFEINFREFLQSSIQNNILFSSFTALIFAPFWEEGVFRKIWLGGKARKIDVENIRYWKEHKITGKRTYVNTFLLSSAIFGLVHGSPLNILIQGVGGMHLAYVYLRTGRCYWAAFALHALYNAVWIFFEYSSTWKNAIFAIML